tara:strand:+ start:3931 stop:4077 length:147 start_codon:yes stop_codon:yes gene_type:complete
MLNKMEKEESPCCTGCWKWNKFGKECHAYWDYKKECTFKEETQGEELL